MVLKLDAEVPLRAKENKDPGMTNFSANTDDLVSDAEASHWKLARFS